MGVKHSDTLEAKWDRCKSLFLQPECSKMYVIACIFLNFSFLSKFSSSVTERLTPHSHPLQHGIWCARIGRQWPLVIEACNLPICDRVKVTGTRTQCN